MRMSSTAFAAAALFSTSIAVAQEGVGWEAGCEPIRRELASALEGAPEMALGNRTKVERLLRDARVADTEEICLTKLRRAHALIAQAYTDADEPLDLMREAGG